MYKKYLMRLLVFAVFAVLNIQNAGCVQVTEPTLQPNTPIGRLGLKLRITLVASASHFEPKNFSVVGDLVQEKIQQAASTKAKLDSQEVQVQLTPNDDKASAHRQFKTVFDQINSFSQIIQNKAPSCPEKIIRLEEAVDFLVEESRLAGSIVPFEETLAGFVELAAYQLDSFATAVLAIVQNKTIPEVQGHSRLVLYALLNLKKIELSNRPMFDKERIRFLPIVFMVAHHLAIAQYDQQLFHRLLTKYKLGFMLLIRQRYEGELIIYPDGRVSCWSGGECDFYYDVRMFPDWLVEPVVKWFLSVLGCV
jgi:hypothetical protein